MYEDVFDDIILNTWVPPLKPKEAKFEVIMPICSITLIFSETLYFKETRNNLDSHPIYLYTGMEF